MTDVLPGGLAGSVHEQVVRFHDRVTGLVGFVAIHSTALGPSLGGTRFLAYPSEAEALADALRLSRAMSYKNALAGLDHGGGKAVLIGDPSRDKTPDLLRAYGRFVEALGGRYVTACDSGTAVPDMDVIAGTCRWVTGRSVDRGGCGDSSVLTAYGLFQGMRAAAEVRWGGPSLAGRTVGVCGVGKVGAHLVRHLVEDGARVVVTDIDPEAVSKVISTHREVRAVADEVELLRTPIDVYAPCALGGALDERTVASLTAAVVCGAANNQLAHPGIADLLATRGVLYAPDYVVNSGGVIQVADELLGFSMERARAKAAGIYGTTLTVLRAAASGGVTPAAAADRLAEARMEGGPWAGTLFPGLAARPPAPATREEPLP
jgi:valine dehydrogenase (NAD+)